MKQHKIVDRTIPRHRQSTYANSWPCSHRRKITIDSSLNKLGCKYVNTPRGISANITEISIPDKEQDKGCSLCSED